jgi:hypothetical protein
MKSPGRRSTVCTAAIPTDHDYAASTREYLS